MALYIRPLSDLHLEFLSYHINLPKLPEDKDTILLLTGDIGVGINAVKWIKKIHKRFKYVIYLLGNHEYYNEDISILDRNIAATIDRWQLDNVLFLNNTAVVINDWYFLGTTLWTDFNDNNYLCIAECKNRLSDFRLIYNRGADLSYEKLIDLHTTSVEFLKYELSRDSINNEKVIVLTHHCPSYNLMNPIHKGDYLNGAFASNLEDLFFNYKIDYWIYGHTHYNIDTTINNTRVISNQKGYPKEKIKEFDINKLICLDK